MFERTCATLFSMGVIIIMIAGGAEVTFSIYSSHIDNIGLDYIISMWPKSTAIVGFVLTSVSAALDSVRYIFELVSKKAASHQRDTAF